MQQRHHRIGDRPHPNVVAWRAFWAGVGMASIPILCIAIIVISWSFHVE